MNLEAPLFAVGYVKNGILYHLAAGPYAHEADAELECDRLNNEHAAKPHGVQGPSGGFTVVKSAPIAWETQP